MKKIEVDLQERSYPIWIKNGIVKQIPDLFDFPDKRKWIIITQQSIQNLFGQMIRKRLISTGLNVTTLVIPEGEEAKSLSQVESIYHKLLMNNCDRSSILVAFGGGVVGDVTGYVAATFMRGIEYLQVPTTLLSMVDSAIGGKTGVNLHEGKNLVGAFHQPRGVIIDPELLHFLPNREVISAMGEILKYGAIRDRAFFELLKENITSLLSLDNSILLGEAIIRCCEIKADIVSHDERETDLRRILNFGHTIGHALEITAVRGNLKHGEAIAYGMIAAGQISHDLGYLVGEDLDLLVSTIRLLPLPELSKGDSKIVLETIKYDKKVQTGKLHFVVLKGLGNAVITDRVTDELCLQSLAML